MTATRDATSVGAVGVVVPAHDEEALIGPCLAALEAAAHLVAPAVDVVICVVLDRCSDRTAAIVRDRPAVVTVVNDSPSTIGELRTLGLRRALARLPDAGPRRTWLLSTDADTRVPPTWIRDHLRHAAGGADAVAGVVELDGLRALPAEVQCRYTALVDAGVTADAHTHAYAANLGVRAEAFLAVGGFPAVPAGEEHALLAALRATGRRISTPPDLYVRTSARTRGRAVGGLADLLRGLAVERDPGPAGPQVSKRGVRVAHARTSKE